MPLPERAIEHAFKSNRGRLRTGDGVYFTPAGAQNLAHYVEREIPRWMSARTAPVATAMPEEPKVEAAARAA